MSACGTKRIGNHVARYLGANQQHALAIHFVVESLHDCFGDVFFGHHLYFQAVLDDGAFGGGTDGCDLEMFQASARDAKLAEALPHGFDAVDAGENEPVVSFEIAQGVVEEREGLRLADFDEWNFDDTGAQAAQAGGEAAGLMAGASDENAGSGEGVGFVGAHEIDCRS